MTNQALEAVKHIMNSSHLVVIKIEAEVIEAEGFGDESNTYSVRAVGVSQRGKKYGVSYTDFPLTEQGKKRAEKLAEELNNW
ncbi:HP_PGM_like phosphatase domain protein [Enterococcus phage 53]|uniref:HP_PGM_like phosphatase domain protein n=1 Tax=Enterococcus phage 53 TaxID=3028143 RepID=UPI00403328A2|nr:HP_PGM_like phosphatase domain protein [Enterococcus phage 53]